MGSYRSFSERQHTGTEFNTLHVSQAQERYNATDLAILRILPVERDPSANVFKAVFGIERYMAGYNNSY